MAHWIGASVEGELGVLGSLEHGGGEQEDGHGVEGKISHDQLLTDPDQAVDFVRATKVDALAIAMGTSHGAYKFTRKPDGEILAMHVVEEIHRAAAQHASGDARLVVGAAAAAGHVQPVRRRDAADLGRAGRGDRARHQARRAQGQYRHRLPAGDDRGVPQGGACRAKSEFDPRKFLKPAMDALRDLCRERFEQFGTAGNASRIKVIPLPEMAEALSLRRARSADWRDDRRGLSQTRRRITKEIR